MQGFSTLLFIILPLTVGASTKEVQSQEVENRNEIALFQEGASHNNLSRQLQPMEAFVRDVYFTADFSFTLGRRGGRRCLERKHDKILAILNKGFDEVVGRSKFAGQVSQANEEGNGICDDDSTRRLRQDDTVEDVQSGSLHWDMTAGSRQRRGLRRSSTTPRNRPVPTKTRHLGLRTTFPEHLFHGGFRCRLCSEDALDTSNPVDPSNPDIDERRPSTISQELESLAADMGAHLTSAMQLSGMRCVTRGRPLVKVTLRIRDAQEASRTCGNGRR